MRFIKKDNSTEKLKQLITELHDHRHELAKEKKILNLFLNDGIVYLVDLETHEILFMNKQGEKEYGEWENKSCMDVIECNENECLECSRLSNNNNNFDNELIFRKRIVNRNNKKLLIKESSFEITNGAVRKVKLEQVIDITDL